MKHIEKINCDIEAWETFQQEQKRILDDAERYGDYGSKVSAEEMIRYSQERINELETKLTRKGA